MPLSPRAVPQHERVDDETLVRHRLHRFIQPLQAWGDLPDSVTAQELVSVLEPYVPRLVRALHSTPQYRALATTDERERFIMELLESPAALRPSCLALLLAAAGLLRFLHEPLNPPPYPTSHSRPRGI